MIDASKRTFQYCNYWTLNSVTTAIFALYIHTWKNASTWQAQSDLQVGTVSIFTYTWFTDS
jgi:hypothetical protein